MSRSNPANRLERCRKFLGKAKNSFRGKHHLYTGERVHWFKLILKLESSVIPVILPSVFFCGVYGFLVSLLHYFGLAIAFPESNSVSTNAVLSFNIGLTLLLVFRTNTAHERFWEGRTLWGALVNAVRNLSRGISIVIKEQSPKDRVEKEATLRLIVAFAVAMKLHLRAEPVDEQLASLMSEVQYFKLKEANHPSLQIAY